MQKKKLSLSWLFYYLLSFIEMAIVFCPFRLRVRLIPATFRPVAPIASFLFPFVISLLIYAPVVFFVLILINTGLASTELFIVSGFGLVFGTIFRIIQHQSACIIRYDGDILSYKTYGFYEKSREEIPKSHLLGLRRFQTKSRNTKNYKVCIELQDERIILLKVTIFEKKSIRLLEKYCSLFNLKEIKTSRTTEPINDYNININ